MARAFAEYRARHGFSSTDTVPVVLIHGMLDAHLTWRTVAGTLGVDRRVLMPDLPGCGWSERPDASYEIFLARAGDRSLAQQPRIANVDVVGHSFGGGVAHLPPVAAFWGDRDTIILIDHAKAFEASVEGAVFKRFDGCGHYLHQERPRAFVTAIRDFLDDPSAVAVRLKPTGE